MHACSGNMLPNCTCPLLTLTDGSVACTITGLSVPVIRCGTEYSENVSHTPQLDHQTYRDFSPQVHNAIWWFLQGPEAQASRRKEIKHKLRLAQTVFIRYIKQFKARTPPNVPICLPVAIAHVLHSMRMHPRLLPPQDLAQKCTEIISSRLEEIANYRPACKQQSLNMAIGMLYLMKDGLTFNDTRWLPRLPTLNYYLPTTNQLSGWKHLSSKLVCQTENEIKLALRKREGVT